MSAADTRYVLNNIRPDLPATEVPPDTWTDCSNMLGRNGQQQRSQGNSTYSNALYATYPLYFTNQVFNTGQTQTVAGSASAITLFLDSGAPNILPGFTAGSYTPGDVTGGTLNNVAVLNYPNQVPYSYAIGGSLAQFPTTGNGWPAANRCRVMRPWKSHLFAGYITQGASLYPDMLAWSSAATPTGGLPTEWVPTTTNDARSITLADSPGGIVDMVPLRDQLLVFKRDAVYTLSFTGGTLVFSSRKVTDSFGLIAPNCAVDIGGQLVILTPSGDVMLTDGQSFKSIAATWVQLAIGNYLSANLAEQKGCWLAYDESTGDVLVALVGAGSTVATLAYVWNARTQLWGQQAIAPATFGLTYASYTTLPGTNTDLALLGSETRAAGAGALVTVASSQTFYGVGITGTVVRYGLDLGEPDAVKTVVRVDLNVSCQDGATVNLRIGGTLRESEAIVLGSNIPGNAANNFQCPCFATGRFIHLSISSTDPGWQCHGFTVITGTVSQY